MEGNSESWNWYVSFAAVAAIYVLEDVFLTLRRLESIQNNLLGCVEILVIDVVMKR